MKIINLTHMSKIYFKEKQEYRNKLNLIVLSIAALVVIIRGVAFLLTPLTNLYEAIFLFIIALIVGIFIWWLTRLKMKVTISDKNINFKMSPIHTEKISISWKEVENCEIIKTSKAAQWLGSNITFNHEKIFSFTGRNGLAIKTKKGDYYFIGCHKIIELQEALSKMNI